MRVCAPACPYTNQTRTTKDGSNHDAREEMPHQSFSRRGNDGRDKKPQDSGQDRMNAQHKLQERDGFGPILLDGKLSPRLSMLRNVEVRL